MNRDLTQLRVRTLTQKSMEQYEETKEKYETDLHAQWTVVQHLVDSFSPGISQIDYFNNLELDISKAYSDLCTTSSSFMSFLTRIRSTDSIDCYKEHSEAIARCKDTVDNAIDKIENARQRAFEKLSRHSKGSHRSSQSRASTRASELSRKRAKAEAAEVSLTFALQEATIKKEKAALEEQEAKLKAEASRKVADLEADLKLLASHQEVAVAKAEACALDNHDNEAQLRNLEKLEISKPIDAMERTSKYVQEQSTMNLLNPDAQPFKPDDIEQPHRDSSCARNPIDLKTSGYRHVSTPHAQINDQPTYHAQNFAPDYNHNSFGHRTDVQDLTKFLLKKDMLISRLSCFSDKPDTYAFWKGQFKGIMRELDATAIEELDLLSKWLGPQSSKYMLSIRSSNIQNPEIALVRIWERLDERYGSPELIESVIKSKLANFQRITNKDSVRLYELLDILCEIESLMANEQYQSLFGYFNSSSGVSPIISKLPYPLQEKWVSHAHRYKNSHHVPFPPFSCLVQFMRDISKMKNDPGLSFTNESPSNSSFREKDKFGKSNHGRQQISAIKTTLKQESITSQTNKVCPLHKTNHSLNNCRGFREKSYEDRRKFLRENNICYRCCDSDQHKSNKCSAKLCCAICKSDKHASAMHTEFRTATTSTAHGEERFGKVDKNPTDTVSACTQICKGQFPGRSCAKIVLVTLHMSSRPNVYMEAYAILDDQSNRSLVSSHVFETLDIKAETTQYKLTSCAGVMETSGRQTHDLVVSSYDGTSSITIPTVIECNRIPNMRDEIPTPDVAKYHPHLNDITKYLPPLDNNVPISILIGRDVPDAHHVMDQRTGVRNAPYAQKLTLGWVVVGESCLHKVHPKNSVTINKTFILPNGRASMCQPCTNDFEVEELNKEENETTTEFKQLTLDDSVFLKKKDDDVKGMSVDDKEFLRTMDKHVHQNEDGNWEAPLPFRHPRRFLPNNRPQALKRALNLDANLRKDEKKRDHFFDFMEKVFQRNHAEVASSLDKDEERWYLPIFGVYHPRKPNQIRAVFDSSAKYDDVSLNDVLLSGPDINNKLLGVLIRFRKEPIAVTADIESMFHCFVVNKEHRRYLRFFWYEDNDFSKNLVEYQMRVHVFGNCPSPAVASYCLRKTASVNSGTYGEDVVEFVNRNFYVDDGLISSATADEAIDLLQRTRESLQVGGNLRLHKITSNSKEVVDAFEPDDRAKNFKDIDLCVDELPTQQSLGLNWELETDSFTYKVSIKEKPFSRRGLLSTVNGIFDPMGFVAPIVVTGKLLLREITHGSTNWDDPLPTHLFEKWSNWKQSLSLLENLHIPRCYSPASMGNAMERELHVFSDASKQAIASVAYIRTKDRDNNYHVGFVLGKAKVAPTHGHTIPRLELCAAVLAIQISEIILEKLDLEVDKTRFYTDSQVVLGYIHNQGKRFYKYVENRVERIHKSSQPNQWTYVRTNVNPADTATRTVCAETFHNSMWILGPPQLHEVESENSDGDYPLLDPDNDSEVRHNSAVKALKSEIDTNSKEPDNFKFSHRIERFSVWKKIVKTVDLLRSIARKYQKTNHENVESSLITSEDLIIKMVQQEFFSREIECIKNRKALPRNSSIIELNPFLDTNNILRVGGRLRRADFDFKERHPIIVPRGNHVAILLIRHFHESVKHQGRHFTAGALRASGYWIVGEKRMIASILHKCVRCRKLRGKYHEQLIFPSIDSSKRHRLHSLVLTLSDRGTLLPEKLEVVKQIVRGGRSFLRVCILEQSTLK